MPARLFDTIVSLVRSRVVALASGLVLLSLCLLLIADLTGLRDDGGEARREAREARVEALAVRLSMLAASGGPAALEASVVDFVAKTPGAEGAALVRAASGERRLFGQEDAVDAARLERGASLVHVPIVADDRPWGELTIAFAPSGHSRADLAYFGFFAVALFVSCLAYLGKALVQLDPTRAIPERVGSAFDMLVEGVIVLDDRLRVLMVNDAAARIAGKPAKELLGGRIESWPWVRDESWQSPWTTVLATGLAIGDHPVRLAPDESASYTLNCSLIRDDDGEPNGIMITLNDLSAIERKNRELSGTLQKLRRSQESITLKNRELEALASQDPLTGLKNRRALTAELEQQLRGAPASDRPLACLMVDIDHFKRINDTLGHAVGDEVICAVANTLVADSRDSDTVGRIGGEEFVVVLPDTSLADALTLAERIRTDVERLADDPTLPVTVLSASFGVASLAPDIATVEQLLDRADKGLYKAKEGGRNRVAAFEPGDAEDAVRKDDAAAAEAAGGESRSTRELELARELEKKSRDLDELRTFDPITRLPRRAVFVERVERGIAEAIRTGTTLGVVSLGMRDGERFAATLGHTASDALAREFAQRLRDGFRRTDTVSEIVDGHSLSHVGTAEFGLMLEGVADTGDALTIMTRIRRLFAEPIVVEGTRVHAGAVIGAAFFPHDGDGAEVLVARAGEARLEAARQPDRTALRFAGETLEAPSRESLEMESDLYEAVAEGQFSVHYQPKLELASQRISGLEALARWEHPEKGWISPADFIPVAERNGLIDDISAFVTRTSLASLKRWHDAGFDDLTLALNVSAAQLRDPSLVSGLLGAIEAAGVSPEHVEVELTETSVIESPQRARIALGQIRSAGVAVSMDDFGTGYTSLALLADLPLDSVKIDRSFVDTMTENARSRAIVRSIIDMAHALGLSIVGEGVETNDQLAALAAFGCNDVQGYLIGRPLDAADTGDFLRQQARDVPGRRRA